MLKIIKVGGKIYLAHESYTSLIDVKINLTEHGQPLYFDN